MNNAISAHTAVPANAVNAYSFSNCRLGHHVGWPLYAISRASTNHNLRPKNLVRKRVRFEDDPVDRIWPPASDKKNSHPDQSQIENTGIHPFLALHRVPHLYDIRVPPESMRFSYSPSFRLRSHRDLVVPMASSRPRFVRIISREFPWTIDLDYTRTPTGRVITCLDVLCTLYYSLQEYLTDRDWEIADEAKRKTLESARRKRVRDRRDPRLRKVDWLGYHTMFRGLEKDEALAKKRLFPGALKVQETWVVKFKRI